MFSNDRQWQFPFIVYNHIFIFFKNVNVIFPDFATYEVHAFSGWNCYAVKCVDS